VIGKAWRSCGPNSRPSAAIDVSPLDSFEFALASTERPLDRLIHRNPPFRSPASR
jgi:hypothetical protein